MKLRVTIFLALSLLTLTGVAAVEVRDYVWVGGVTDTSATIKAGLGELPPGAEVALVISTSPEFPPEQSVTLSPQDLSDGGASHIAKFSLDRLKPGTQFFYVIEVEGIRDERTGSFQTMPQTAAPASFRFTLGSCSSTGSNHPVFQAISQEEPLFHLITGDFHYENIATNSPDLFRQAYARNFASPGWQKLMGQMNLVYVWDDHDFGPNNCDGTSASKPAAQAVYREITAHYPLPDEGAIYQSFIVGRVPFLVMDVRSERFREPDKQMVSADQMRWLKQELLRVAESPLIVLVSSSPWIAAPAGKNRDNWGGFPEQRQEIAEFLVVHDLHRKVCLLSGDAHMLAIDDGTNNTYAGADFPVFQAAALDRRGSVKGGPYTHGTFPGGGQYGLMEVRDSGGPTVEVHWQGKNAEGEVVVEHSFTSPRQR